MAKGENLNTRQIMAMARFLQAALLSLSLSTSITHAVKLVRAHQSGLTMSSVTNGVIVGGGRIGEMMYDSNMKQDVLLRSRDDQLPAGSGPIYVATRNNDLEAIIEKTPENRREDLVFLQNGMLAPYLKKKGLLMNTQGLIYFAVAKKGEKPIDGVTDLNPEGLTSITGKVRPLCVRAWVGGSAHAVTRVRRARCSPRCMPTDRACSGRRTSLRGWRRRGSSATCWIGPSGRYVVMAPPCTSFISPVKVPDACCTALTFCVSMCGVAFSPCAGEDVRGTCMRHGVTQG